MSSGSVIGPFVYDLPAVVLCEFCWVMDALSDLDWTRFASEVLGDQTTVRLAQKKENRTEWVMTQWASRKGRISQLVDLLDRQGLLRPRDIILEWAASWKPSSPPPPAPPPLAPAVCPAVPTSLAQLAPPSKPSKSPPMSHTCVQSPHTDEGGGIRLPLPAPAPSSLHSNRHPPPQPLPVEAACSSGVMCWSYEEVHAGTDGFSPSLQVGEGGFGVVYKASLKNTDCAVKRLKQDWLSDWKRLKESFQTEVDKLSKFRHPNIVDLLGFSEGPESVCLIYSYMDNRSLEDQLRNKCPFLSWSQRVGVVKEASTALQFLHSPPEGHRALIHGDVKSSNILLDRHMTAKLADFGLARFASDNSSERSPSQTTTVGRTATIRGTLAYLPDEYVREGKMGTTVDVFSFGVVLLEVLTGRRALETDRNSRDRYLKDLVDEVKHSPDRGEQEAAWRKQLDHRLITGGATEPALFMQVATLALKCLDRNRRRRPPMTKVFEKLREIDSVVKRAASSASSSSQPPSRPFPGPSPSVDSSVLVLSQGLSKLGPLEDTYHPSQLSSSSSSSFSSSSSSSSYSLPSHHSLHSTSSLSSTRSSLPLSQSPSSFAGPCETDESRGYSQYDLGSQLRDNGTGPGSVSPSLRDQPHSAAGPTDSRFSQPSVPTEDQYNFPPQTSCTTETLGALALTGATAGVPGGSDSLSPVRSLQSLFPRPSVVMNPSKQHFLRKKALYEEGRIETPELLSSDDLYGEQSSGEVRGLEESDELDYLPAKHH